MKFFGWQSLIRKKKYPSNGARIQIGFTLIEMLVSTAIILFISGQVLVSFSTLRESSTLTRAAQELSFNIRRAQNMSLSVVAVGIGGITQIPHAVGLRLSSQSGSNTSYFFFADQDSNGMYSGAIERIEPNILLPGNIKITSITGELIASPGVHIIFYTPEATLILSNGVAGAIPNFMSIILTAPSGATRIVRIRISGQVIVY